MWHPEIHIYTWSKLDPQHADSPPHAGLTGQWGAPQNRLAATPTSPETLGCKTSKWQRDSQSLCIQIAVNTSQAFLHVTELPLT